MKNSELSGSTKALLDEYKKAINELISVIRPISSDQLGVIADSDTKDPACRSIQIILSHVVGAGYYYSVSIENSTGLKKTSPERVDYDNVKQYIEALNAMFEYCEAFFIKNPDLAIEQTDNSKKINVSWGQQYDIEQLLEHAIVHILRHRRQIENFMNKQNNDPSIPHNYV